MATERSPSDPSTLKAYSQINDSVKIDPGRLAFDMSRCLPWMRLIQVERHSLASSHHSPHVSLLSWGPMVGAKRKLCTDVNKCILYLES